MVMSTPAFVALSMLAHNPQPLPAPAPFEATGKVREILGSAERPQAVLELDDKSELVLHGATELDDAELRRLAGVRIKTKGIKGDPLLPRGNHVRVAHYDILDVGGGVVPRIGRIASLDLNGTERLLFVDDDGSAQLLPLGWASKMTKHVGAKVWLVGTRAKAELTPTRFAILRPGEKAEKNDLKEPSNPE